MMLTASLTDRKSILNPATIPNSHIAGIINMPMADVAENINEKMMRGLHENDVGISTLLHTSVLILITIPRSSAAVGCAIATFDLQDEEFMLAIRWES